MRIALVVPGGVSRDGERKVIPAILSLLSRLTRHHEVHVVVPRQEDEPAAWELRGATVHNLGGWRRTWVPRAVAKLAKLHGDHPFDVFHAIWARGPGEAAVMAARLCRRRVVVHVAGGELVWLPSVRFGSRRPWRRSVTHWVLRSADRVTAASEPMIRLVESCTGIRPTRVPLGPDTTIWIPEPPRRRKHDAPARLVSVGSLTAVKDHSTLLHSVAELIRRGRDVVVDLVGLDTSRGTVPALMRELGLEDRVRIHGFLTQSAAREVVRAADVMLVTSRYEAGPVAMLEAAAVGVPTVGTPVGHVHEWAPGAAVMAAFGEPGAFADALCRLFDAEEERLDLAREAQARALAEDADWTAGRFEQIYRELSERRA